MQNIGCLIAEFGGDMSAIVERLGLATAIVVAVLSTHGCAARMSIRSQAHEMRLRPEARAEYDHSFVFWELSKARCEFWFWSGPDLVDT